MQNFRHSLYICGRFSCSLSQWFQEEPTKQSSCMNLCSSSISCTLSMNILFGKSKKYSIGYSPSSHLPQINLIGRSRYSTSPSKVDYSQCHRSENQWRGRLKAWGFHRVELRKLKGKLPKNLDSAGQKLWFRKHDDGLLLLDASLLSPNSIHINHCGTVPSSSLVFHADDSKPDFIRRIEFCSRETKCASHCSQSSIGQSSPRLQR